ncbi:tubulin binding cofactor E [Cavenderia fasciculata]|uniref:Tubulin binding cofactor E n=1 Tax=Cavenderia fasciculata TaxID=261658 RepID=F4PWQ8_CACFS|nr:tubulin binding cofactor E [Cavenderia fasciculata]EGG20422.1 tubulin binding cofactor E [Cavenderia fasciculata]|eukprot:XP_004367405.1 tubulin binding cofactor E [Cavenderia fasciculata]
MTSTLTTTQESQSQSQSESELQSETTTTFQIGDRIISSDDDHYGTIRYMGDVDGFAGMWYGIEWDDPTRGKHKGTIKQRTYFGCTGGGSGSFMKIEKLVGGTNLIHALLRKFGHKIDNYDDLYVLSNLDNKVPIELIGMEKIRERQQHLNGLVSINACDLKISTFNPTPAILNTLTCLEELNLSHNLLSNWKDIPDLLKQIPTLDKLILSENRMEVTDEFIDYISTNTATLQFNNIKTLVLNKTNIKWDRVVSLCKYMFRELQVLRLADNHIDSTKLKETEGTEQSEQQEESLEINSLFPSLSVLDLCFNTISSFNSIRNIGYLSKLEELNVSNNLIENIVFPKTMDDGSTTKIKGFGKLSTLYLSHNKITTVESIDELDLLPSLVDLSLRENPILYTFKSTVESNQSTKKVDMITQSRLNIIPRITSLLAFNLTKITDLERKDSEIYFLSEFFKPDIPINLQSPKIKHLVQIYGEPSYTK